MTIPAARTATRPISVEHVDDTQHVVHGVYGFVLVNARIHAHLALTWAAARPTTVVFSCITATTGSQEWLYIDRGLLKSGGKLHVVKVDFAGDIAFIEISAGTRCDWMGLNRRWLADFIAATDAVASQQPSPHPGR